MKNLLSPALAGASLLIIAGIITNSIIDGEHLIVKFLATVVVAALGLYVISDLRLRTSENPAVLSNQSISIETIQEPELGQTTMPLFRSKGAQKQKDTAPPTDSTAAFMAKVNNTDTSTASRPTTKRTYSTMSRINQRHRSAAAGKPNPTPKVKDPRSVPTIRVEEATSAKIEEQNPHSLDDITVSAPPLRSLRDMCEAASPDQPQPTDTIPPGVYSPVVDAKNDNTSIISLPSASEIEALDSPDDHETAWILVEKSSTDEDKEDDRAVNGPDLTQDPNVHIVDELDDLANTAEPTEIDTQESRRFTTEDITIANLRPANLKHVDQPISSRHSAALAAVNEAITAGEKTIVTSLIERGILSSEGPITNDDVSTMIYVAFTSSELRTLLIEGGTVDTDSPINLEGIGIYTSDELAQTDTLLVAGPSDAIAQLQSRANR